LFFIIRLRLVVLSSRARNKIRRQSIPQMRNQIDAVLAVHRPIRSCPRVIAYDQHVLPRPTHRAISRFRSAAPTAMRHGRNQQIAASLQRYLRQLS